MTTHKTVATIVLLAAWGGFCLAGDADKQNVKGTTSINTADHYVPILINNIFNYYGNNGDGSYNRLTANSAFEFPKGTGKAAIFEDGIVWGGFHKGRSDPKVGGSVYRHGLQPGRILIYGGPSESEAAVADDPLKPEYRIYRVRMDVSPFTPFSSVQTILEEEASLTGRYQPEANALALYDAYVKDWNEWPAKTADAPAGLAPFTDINGNGTYEPSVDIPGEPGGNQTLYYVANDLNSAYTQNLAGCPPIGLEMHRTFWGYQASSGALGNTIFSRTILINKGGAPVDSMFLVQWSDPDVGDSGDDFAGCDRARNLGFAYNGRPTDAVYGAAVPAVGYRLLQGPIVPSTGDSALFRMAYRQGFKNLAMTAFTFFTQGGGGFQDPVQGPGGDIEWYRLMNGRKAATGDHFIDPLTSQPTKFALDGDPVTGQGWIDGMALLTPQDRRICLVSGPFTLANGDTQELVVATIIGLGGDRISSIAMLKHLADLVQASYDAGFKTFPPLASAQVLYPDADSARVTLSIDTRSGIGLIQSVSGDLKDTVGVVAHITFSDDGTHGDLTAGDRIFTHAITIRRTLKPLSLDLFTLSTTSELASWPSFLAAITVAGPVSIGGPIIFSDNINNDGECNPGENIRFGVSTVNSTEFALQLRLASCGGGHIVPLLPSGATDIMSYDPDNSQSYFVVDLPASPMDSGYGVPISIYDTVGNLWSATVTFDIVPLADTIKTALLSHVSGLAGGSFQINVVHPTEVRSHLYVIRGVDSINSSGDPGITLKDSTDGRILLLNHPLPDSLGHNIPVTDGFKVMRGSIDYRYGYKTYEVRSGSRPWSWVNGSLLELEGFGGAIGAGYSSWLGVSPSVTARQLSSVLIRFANTDGSGWLSSANDSLVSYAYRYMRNAAQPPAKPDFNRFILNPTAGYAYQDYTRVLPFAAYDIGKAPPVRLMVGFLENNTITGTVDGMYWPPYMGDDIDNTEPSGPREWFFLFNAPYSETALPLLETDILNNPVPILWWGTPTRRFTTFREGDELVIRAFQVPTSSDLWTFNPEIIASAPEQMNPRSFELSQNYPNPFNPKTVVGFQLPGVSDVKLSVYDLLGREVAVLVNERKGPGTYELTFDGSGLASGVYFYRLKAGSFVQTRKMLLIQ